MDYYSISGVNYIIDNYDGDYRTLSWSWDGKYIAFEGGTTYEVKDLFRLDVATGEVEGLTTRYANNQYPPTLGGYAPAWGP